MSRASKFKHAYNTIRAWLIEHPTRQALTMDEFYGGLSPLLDYKEPPTPYTGEHLDKVAVAQVFGVFQRDGILGSPFKPMTTLDQARPRQFRVRRIPEPGGQI